MGELILQPGMSVWQGIVKCLRLLDCSLLQGTEKTTGYLPTMVSQVLPRLV